MPRLRTLLSDLLAVALLAVSLFSGPALLTAPASAQDYPNRPITLVVPFPPGGGTTIVARIVADKMSEALGQSIVVDNRGGAGGTIGSRAVSRSAPDGYTILLGYTGTLAIGPTLYGNAGYDPRKDFDADRPDRNRAEHAGGASFDAGPFGRRADRLCQGQSGQGQLRLGRNRHGQPCLRGIFRNTAAGVEAHPHSLQGDRPRDHRPPRRSHSDGLRADPGHARKRQERQAAHARGHQHGALDPAAGRADDRGDRRARLRGGVALWPRCAARDARRRSSRA